MKDEAKWLVTGAVVDKFAAPSGKFGRVKIETSVDGRRAKHELKCFDAEVIKRIATLGAGEMITVVGKLGVEILKDRKGEEVKSADGQSFWVPSLIVMDVLSDSVAVRPDTYSQKRNDFKKARESAFVPSPDGQPDAIPDDDIPF